MLLKDYLDHKNETLSQFARRSNVSIATVYNAISGKNDLKASILDKIIEATDGVVTLKDLLPAELRVKLTCKKRQKRPAKC